MGFDERILRGTQGVVVDLTHAPTSDLDLAPALDAMRAIEAGAVANATEHRQVGHYWLRDPGLAPTPEIRAAIETTLARIKALDLHAHELVMIGIGGFALGPQLGQD